MHARRGGYRNHKSYPCISYLVFFPPPKVVGAEICFCSQYVMYCARTDGFGSSLKVVVLGCGVYNVGYCFEGVALQSTYVAPTQKLFIATNVIVQVIFQRKKVAHV